MPTSEAAIEAAAEAVHYAQGFDDWGVANETEREWSLNIAAGSHPSWLSQIAALRAEPDEEAPDDRH